MNLLSSDILQNLHTQLIWLGFASVLFLLILKLEATLYRQLSTGGPGSCPHHCCMLWRALLIAAFSPLPTEVPVPLGVNRKRQGHELGYRQRVGRTKTKGFTTARETLQLVVLSLRPHFLLLFCYTTLCLKYARPTPVAASMRHSVPRSLMLPPASCLVLCSKAKFFLTEAFLDPLSTAFILSPTHPLFPWHLSPCTVSRWLLVSHLGGFVCLLTAASPALTQCLTRSTHSVIFIKCLHERGWTLS